MHGLTSEISQRGRLAIAIDSISKCAALQAGSSGDHIVATRKHTKTRRQSLRMRTRHSRQLHEEIRFGRSGYGSGHGYGHGSDQGQSFQTNTCVLGPHKDRPKKRKQDGSDPACARGAHPSGTGSRYRPAHRNRGNHRGKVPGSFASFTVDTQQPSPHSFSFARLPSRNSTRIRRVLSFAASPKSRIL